MEKSYIGRIIKRVFVITLLWTGLFIFLNAPFANSLAWGLLFGVVFEGVFPFAHEYLHKIAYKFFHSDADISIHLGDGLWFVFDESEYVYSKEEMVIILLAPILVTIVSVILLVLVSNPFLQVLFGYIGIANFLGMMGTPKQKGDILYVLEMLKEDSKAYKFAKSAQLIKM